MKEPVVIAEVGCNHMGNFEIAKQFIRTAKEYCNVHLVKFQKRNIKEILTPKEYNSPHPQPHNAYGETYGKHREFLEFSIDQHCQLKNYCQELGVTYSCSVWDLTSAKEIVSLNPQHIKIPSATNTNLAVLEYLSKNYEGRIHMSLGMTSRSEEMKAIEVFELDNRLGDIVLYACTSGYPVPAEDVCLLEIVRLNQHFGKRVHAIGFSGHHNGIAIDIAAYTLGASYIERHFTLDRTWKGTDHAASLEPLGLLKLNRDLLNTFKAMGEKKEEILPIEVEQRKKLKWNRHKQTVTLPSLHQQTEPESGYKKIKLVCMDVDGVLTDSGMYYTERGDELKKFNTRDGQGIALLKNAGIKTGIITRENTEIVSRRAQKIGVDHLYQGVMKKLDLIKQLAREMSIDPSQICFIGDDIHDIECLKYAGFSAVPQDAMIPCKEAANYVCLRKGGEGCVREVVELILSSSFSS